MLFGSAAVGAGAGYFINQPGEQDMVLENNFDEVTPDEEDLINM